MFQIGDRVKFVHTGDKGTITSVMQRGNMYVKLDDGMEIPAYPDDIKILLPEEEILSTPKNHNISTAKQESHFKKGRIRKGHRVTNKGVLLCFEPYMEEDGTVDSYDIFLINDTPYDVIFNLKMKCLDFESEEFSDKIEGNSGFDVGVMYYEELNDHPTFEVNCWRVTTMGLDKEINNKITVKPKTFFKKANDTPILNRTTHIYPIITKFQEDLDGVKSESLAEYTKRNTKDRKNEELVDDYYKLYNLKDKAEFKDEIDLHIENLTADHASMNNKEKLLYQIKCFEDYLEEAIRVGFPRVYIIHGIGKGRLRDNITAILIRNPYVKSFKNEHHPKYGFGATEVILA